MTTGQSTDRSDDLLARFAALADKGLTHRLGIEVLHAHRGDVMARMPVEGNTQPMGLLHGGASAALAETIGSWAAAIAAPDGHAPVGLELNATHHAAARGGHVTGRARVLREGRRVASYAIEIRDEADQLVCTARLTCMFVPYSG